MLPSDDRGAFGKAWQLLFALGFAVIPLDGKKPLVKGFSRWKSPPNASMTSKWIKSFSSADVGIMPGLSNANGDPLVVVDADDEAAGVQVVDVFGYTPLQVKTRRGIHFYYKSQQTIPAIVSLKVLGINGDLKAGNSFVVAPPSRHADDREFYYSWLNCRPSQITEVPDFPVAELSRLVERETQSHHSGASKAFRDGSRGLGLNDLLAAKAPLCSTFDEVHEIATAFNAGLIQNGYRPLSAGEVRERSMSAWKDVERGKLVPMVDGIASAIIRDDEFNRLLGERHGENALALLILLRLRHGARMRSGETFAISARAMENSHVIGKWAARTYRNAKKVLIETGILRLVEEAERGRAAQYTLSPPQQRKPPQST